MVARFKLTSLIFRSFTPINYSIAAASSRCSISNERSALCSHGNHHQHLRITRMINVVRYYSRLGSRIQSSDVRKGKRIKAKSVLLIDDNGTNLGKMDTPVAVKMAVAKGLELIQVTKDDDEPVCKLISKKKLWEETKTARERNKKDPKMIMKEVQVMVGISEHDLQTKVKAIQAFLEKDHSIKLWVQRKRRQRFKVGQNEQEQLLKEIMEQIKDLGSKSNESYTPKGLSCIVRSIQKK